MHYNHNIVMLSRTTQIMKWKTNVYLLTFIRELLNTGRPELTTGISKHLWKRTTQDWTSRAHQKWPTSASYYNWTRSCQVDETKKTSTYRIRIKFIFRGPFPGPQLCHQSWGHEPHDQHLTLPLTSSWIPTYAVTLDKTREKHFYNFMSYRWYRFDDHDGN